MASNSDKFQKHLEFASKKPYRRNKNRQNPSEFRVHIDSHLLTYLKQEVTIVVHPVVSSVTCSSRSSGRAGYGSCLVQLNGQALLQDQVALWTCLPDGGGVHVNLVSTRHFPTRFLYFVFLLNFHTKFSLSSYLLFLKLCRGLPSIYVIQFRIVYILINLFMWCCSHSRLWAWAFCADDFPFLNWA